MKIRYKWTDSLKNIKYWYGYFLMDTNFTVYDAKNSFWKFYGSGKLSNGETQFVTPPPNANLGFFQ